MPRSVPRFAIPALILLCAALYLLGNGRVALWDRDEPRYAMASRYMLQSGDWVVPRIGWGQEPATPRTKKPVLTYWCQAAAMRAFGPTDFAARFPSSVSTTLLLTLLAVVISRRLTRAHAFWTTLVLGTAAMLAVASKMCVTDTILLLFVTTAQLCLLALYRGSRSIWVSVAMWTALALGGLTKGPVVLGIQLTTVLVLAVLDYLRNRQSARRHLAQLELAATTHANATANPQELAYFTPAQRRGDAPLAAALRWWPRTRPLLGLLIIVAICGPWLYLVHHREPTFLTQAIGHDVIDRIKQGQEGHSGPPGYYLVTLAVTFFPWSLLLPLAFILAFKRLRLPHVRFALAATIGPWILMELVSTKLVHYVLPIFPPLAFLVADAILRCLRHRHDGLTSRVARAGVAAWCVAVALAVASPWILLALSKNHPSVPTVPLAAMTVTGLAMAALVLVAFASRRPAAGLLSMGVGFAAFLALAFGWFLPRADFIRLPTRIAAVLVANGATRPGDELMTDYKEQSLAFYQGGTIDQTWENYLKTHDVKDWPTWFVLTPKVLADAPPDRAAALEKVADFHGFNYAAGKWVDVWVMKKRQ